jgi:hypothetical protein
MGWEYRHMPLPADWEHECLAWIEAALYKGDAHLNALQLAGVLWGHHARSTISRAHVLGIGGEDWRGYYYSGESFNLGRTTQVNYDRLLEREFAPAIPVKVMRQDRTAEVGRALRESVEEFVTPYTDLPNTFKLDRYHMYQHTSHGGAYLSAVSGIVRSLMPLCCKEPITFAFSLNYQWKLPRHFVFVRTLLERENPRLANLRTAKGGPATPIRLTNIHQFWTLWRDTLNGVAIRASQRLLGKAVTVWPLQHYSEYPLPTWRVAWLKYAQSEGILKPSEMRSGALYNANALRSLVAQIEAGAFEHAEFLDRVITVEMAMRAVGASVG